MSLRIVLRREAEREYEEAIVWYEGERAGLEATFIAAVDSALEQIRETPYLHPNVHQDARRAVLHRFPYSIIYRIEANRVLVLAISHASRDPAIWRARV